VTNEHRSGTPDELLVQLARRGDERALGALVDRHQGAVFRTAVSIVSDPDLAQDVTQDTFVKAMRALDGFRGDAAFRTWLLTIAANTARGVLRRSGRRVEVALDAIAPVASDETDPAQNVALGDEAARARALLLQLPEKQRLAVQLRVDEGLSFREIGDVIGSSEGAARVNYFHGIRRLREWME